MHANVTQPFLAVIHLYTATSC